MPSVDTLVFRVLAISFLLVAGLVKVTWAEFMVNKEAQLVATTVAVAMILLGDAIAGLAMGLGVLLLYFRIYREMLGFPGIGGAPGSIDRSLVGTDYVTPEDLKRAQDNVVDETNFATEMKGVRGVYGEPVYGAQGMDRTMPGYDVSPFAMPKDFAL